MFSAIQKRFRRDRRAATAVALAIMFVPMMIAASAAVDFSRIASARTLMQASVDSAAVAGVGAYQISQVNATAVAVTKNVYSGTSAQLANFVSISAPSIGVYCNGTSAQCGGTSFVPPTGGNCPNGTEYCVVVSETAILKNSLFASIIPSEVLRVTGAATASFPSTPSAAKAVAPTSGFGSASDYSAAYAYSVPMSGNTPEYANQPAANSACSTVIGPLALLINSNSPAGTSCNYLFIADSLNHGGSSGNSIIENPADPVSFTFANETGGSSSYGMDTTYNYTNDIVVNNTLYPNGYTTTAVSAVRCSNNQNNCTPQTAVPATVLYGQCPTRNLYGSTTSSPSSGALGAPPIDTVNIYDSVYEVLGEPPTYLANHTIAPFISPTIAETVGSTTYNVSAMCPQWPTTATATNVPANTDISAPTTQASSYALTSSGTNSNYVVPVGFNIYATWYPQTQANDDLVSENYTNGTAADIFPPPVSACTPAPYPYARGKSGNATWWGWSDSNAGNCSIDNAMTGSVTSSGGQAAADDNCALLIQNLGPDVPVSSTGYAILPDYYASITDGKGNVLALDPMYDNVTFVDLIPGVAPLADSNTSETYNSKTGLYQAADAQAAGFYPTNTTPAATRIPNTGLPGGGPNNLAAGIYAGDYVVVEQPAKNDSGYDHSLPASTSHQCYNPQANGYQATDIAGANDNGTANDPVEDAKDGAVLCDLPVPDTYALYWNDMGSTAMDDLGYWNAIESFTCSAPSGSTTGGGAATLSG
jgi:Flp pilus assembly protein TadG